MIIRRARHFTVKMGGPSDYEMYKFGAEVELSHEDLGIPTSEVLEMSPSGLAALRERLTEAVLAELDEQLIGEVQEAAELTEHRRSFLLRTIANTSAKPSPSPRKANHHA